MKSEVNYVLFYNEPNFNDINYKYKYSCIKVTAGIDYDFAKKYNQRPYFSITGNILNGNGIILACGCVHDQMLEAISEREQRDNLGEIISELIKWHSCDINGLPLYYIENSMYWFKNQKYDTFKSYILMGQSSLDEQMIEVYQTMDNESIIAWLEARKPDLKANFLKAMNMAGIEVLVI